MNASFEEEKKYFFNEVYSILIVRNSQFSRTLRYYLNTRLGPKRGVQVIALYEFSYDMSYHFDWRKLSHTMNKNMVYPLYES